MPAEAPQRSEPPPTCAAVDTRLEAYLSMLERWNAVFNLTAVRDRESMRLQHVADCLAVVAPLRRELSGLEGGPATVRRILDVGSGGGLPGVILALANPAWQVTCVDAVGKKAAFIQQVGSELGLPNLKSVHARVEKLRLPPFDAIVSRAFASLGDFVRLTRHALAPGGQWMAMKGREPVEEMSGLPAGVRVFHVEPLQVPGLEAERCLVWLRETGD